jgi:hypothetical protein
LVLFLLWYHFLANLLFFFFFVKEPISSFDRVSIFAGILHQSLNIR